MGFRMYGKRFYSTSPSNSVINKFMNDVYYNLQENGRNNSSVREFNQIAYNILMKYKKDPNMRSLESVQKHIENITTQFDENNIFKECSNIINQLIGNNNECAKDYLYSNKLNEDLYSKYIYPLGQYTLEAIIIYVLGVLFYSINEASIVRVSTLIEKLDNTVRRQADIINKSRTYGNSSLNEITNKKEKTYQIGILLVEYMSARGLIQVDSIVTDSIVKKNSGYHPKSNLFVICNFELKNLPLKLNLPMVCKPIDWKLIDQKMTRRPIMLSDMCGGYLSVPTLDIYNRFKLISTRNVSNFNIELNEEKINDVCQILNGIQKQGFKINKRMLDFIIKNRDTLERDGLLMPRILAHVNMREAFDILRLAYFNNDEIKKVTSLGSLFQQLSNDMQVARYEDSIIRIASAYEGYVFYLPAFMDFRGRIYRAGILHFHERDFARSLIVFANSQQDDNKPLNKDILAISAAYKYRKFNQYEKAHQWYKEKQASFHSSDDTLISFAKGASDPYQFISKALCLSNDKEEEYKVQPISQDASSSAYQIMSYLLLNKDMAMKTNLILHPDGLIQDVYTHMLNELKDYLYQHFNDQSKMRIIDSMLDRKLVKRLFMPLIYGKTVITMINDLRDTYKQLISQKDCNKMAKLCKSFWAEKYPDIDNLMKLIAIISWFCSEMDRPVVYSIPFFTTKQDYMCFNKESLSVYEKITRKRRRVTILMPTTKRDKRKTQAAACANFIHQKDAYIAMKVSESLLRIKAPIYTVHDNFITTIPYVRSVPDIYTEVFINMGQPSRIINSYIHINLIRPILEYNQSCYNYKDTTIPIQYNHLKEILNDNQPEHYSTKAQRKRWELKIEELILYYSKYVEGVCGTPINSLGNKTLNEERWDDFKKLMLNRSHCYSIIF